MIAYLDPARPQDLRFDTVSYLAEAFDYLDLIINLPVNSLMRAIHGAYRAGGEGPGAAGRFLGHDRPHELLRRFRAARIPRRQSPPSGTTTTRC
ncbi:MAG TPA: hypothetical protein VFH80_00630 [Solirubrobacteraceae bacterium]|nr:hypothetical protein [Solirubrobacteraceae bacterium]